MGVKKRFLLCLAATAAILPATDSLCLAQPVPPSVGYVYPAGAKQGTIIEATIGGQFIRAAKTAYISGSGVQVKITSISKPLTQEQVNDLRDKLKELRQTRQSLPATTSSRPASRPASSATTSGPANKPSSSATTTSGPTSRLATNTATSSGPASAPASAEEIAGEIATISEQLAEFERARDLPSLAETVKIEIVVDASAPPGRRELRLEGPNGLSNPLVFCVGSLGEHAEPITKATQIVAVTTGQNMQRIQERLAQATGQDIPITLPVVLNGQITPGGVDRYIFSAGKGRHIVVATAARELIPYMADAVPGWFDAVVTIYDAKGNELACADHYMFSPDPAMCFDAPAAGQYTLEIRDILYRGREDFVYRLAVGEIPFITGIFPMGGPATTDTPVAVRGWNLPAGTMVMKPATTMPALLPVRAVSQESYAGPLFFATDTLNECLKGPPDKKVSGAQPVELPTIVNGRIDQPGQWDVYSFTGRAGQKIVAEVLARRLGSPLDSVVKLTDASGKTLAMNDDFADKSAGLVTHQADSFLLATLPAEGQYRLAIADIQGNSGDLYAYRLRIGPPREDFELRVVPSAINIRGGQTMPITVHAIRHDGFAGPINLSLENAPAGFALSGSRVPVGQDQIRLTLTAPTRNIAGPITLGIQGQAEIDGRPVIHQALAADDRMEAFGKGHLVPADGPMVCMIGQPMPRGTGTIVGEMPVSIPAGGTATVEFTIPQRAAAGDIILELSDPPPGISVQKVQSTGNRTEMVLSADAKTAHAGLEGNLIINVSIQPASAPSTASATSTPSTSSAPSTTSAPSTASAPSSTSAPSTSSAPSSDKPKIARKTTLGTLPAIAFKVVNP